MAEATREDGPLRSGVDLDLRRTTPDLRALELQRVMDGAEVADAAPDDEPADPITTTAAERPSVRAAALVQTAAERPSVRFRAMDIGDPRPADGPSGPAKGGARVITLTPPPDDGDDGDFSAFTPTPAPAAPAPPPPTPRRCTTR
ncbi:MAG: hypothetical protein H6704_09165 [Myxococcales bacterium]|nr:hypothetical protein [Myxococcales bacterium]